MKRVIFYGNSQAAILSSVYDRFVAASSDVGSDWASSSPADLEETEEKVVSAELLVAQVGSSEGLSAIDALNSAARKILFPAVSAAFLWPFGGQQHPQNRQTKYRKVGPYDGQLGDSYLNRKIGRCADVEATLAEYERLEAAQLPDLDRMFDLAMEQQRWRDEATGFSFASRIADQFRTERLFIGPDRPAPALARHFILAVFERFIPERATLATVERGLARSPFPDFALPIHPAVARHFGLTFLGDAPRYRYGHEGTFTFAEYGRRYMRYTWSPDLDDALAGLRSPKPERTITRLESALAQTPTSAFGYAALAGLLSSVGRQTEALEAARTAVALDSDHARTHVRLAAVFQKAGLAAETERELRSAVACDPTDLNGLSALSRFLLQHERLDEALEVSRRMAALEPEREPIRIQIVTVLLRLNRTEDAEQELRAALEVAPDNATLHRSLSNLLANRRDFAGAEAEARRAIDLDPETVAHHVHLATMMMRQGRLDEAAGVLRAALTRAPDNAMALSTLGLVLDRQRKPEEALRIARRATELAPRNPAFKARLDRLMERSARLADTRPKERPRQQFDGKLAGRSEVRPVSAARAAPSVRARGGGQQKDTEPLRKTLAEPHAVVGVSLVASAEPNGIAHDGGGFLPPVTGAPLSEPMPIGGRGDADGRITGDTGSTELNAGVPNRETAPSLVIDEPRRNPAEPAGSPEGRPAGGVRGLFGRMGRRSARSSEGA